MWKSKKSNVLAWPPSVQHLNLLNGGLATPASVASPPERRVEVKMTQPQSDESSDEEDADDYCEDNPKTDNTGLSLFLFAFFKIVWRVNQ